KLGCDCPGTGGVLEFPMNAAISLPAISESRSRMILPRLAAVVTIASYCDRVRITSRCAIRVAGFTFPAWLVSSNQSGQGDKLGLPPFSSAKRAFQYACAGWSFVQSLAMVSANAGSSDAPPGPGTR